MNNIIDGKKISNIYLEEYKEKINKMVKKPTLVVIQVGNNPASNIYVNNKKKLSHEAGINFVLQKYEKITEKKLIEEIRKLNKNKKVNAILVQLPLPKEINEENVIESIDPNKDVDGLTSANIGRLFSGKDGIVPCTALGVINLLKYKKINLEGKNVTIVGRSKLVGLPLIALLQKENATVTICHSKTKKLKDKTQEADVLIVAVGKPNLIKKDMVKENAIIIDVGINRANNKICGDVEFSKVKETAKLITPVPGGVGPMTVATLINNVIKCYEIQKK